MKIISQIVQSIKYRKVINLKVLILFLMAMNIISIAQVKMPDNIIFGTVYNVFHDRFKTDQEFYDQVKLDMKNIKETNLNLVMPFPLGEWNNEKKIRKWTRSDFLVKQVEANGLKMLPIMLKANSRNWISLWKYLEIKDADREDPSGIKGRNGGIYNMKYQNPEIKKVFEEYVASLTKRYKDSPAMVGYDLWNEPHYFSVDEITIPKYREWLRNKYKSISELDRVWGRDYSSWEEIDPTQRGNWTSSMPDIDLELFRQYNNAEVARWADTTLRKYDSKHWININTCQSMLSYFRGDVFSVDEWAMAPLTDVFGISCYVDEWERWISKGKEEHPNWRLSMIFNAIRCASKDKPYILTEMQTNMQSGLRLEKALTYDDMYIRSWIALANDCKGIIYWKWRPFLRGQQTFGRGLTQTDGQLAERGKAVKDIGKVLENYGSIMFNAKIEPAKVAILWDIIGYYKATETKHIAQMFFNDSYEGTYKALWEKNISVDIVRTDRSFTLEELKKYKIIFMPFQIVVSEKTAKLLKEYVKEGGWLIADARTGIIDDLDFGYPVNPGGGLDKVFGVRRMDWQGREEPIFITLNPKGILNNAFTDNIKLKGKWYKEKLELLNGAETLATFDEDGTPALVENNYGKGVAVIAAFPLGGSYRLNNDNNIQKLIATFVRKAGVQQDVILISEQPTKGCMIKSHVLGSQKLIYICNTGTEKVKGVVKLLKTENKIFSTAKDLISNNVVNLIANQDSTEYSFNININPKRVALYLIK